MFKKLRKAALLLTLFGLAIGGAGAWFMFRPNTLVYEGTRSVMIPTGSSFEAVLDSLDGGGILASRSTFAWMVS